MTYSMVTVDDIVFGADPKRELPTVNGYDWMGQIDYKYHAMQTALSQFMDVIQDIFRELPKVEAGSYTVPVLSSFDDRLEQTLETLPYGSTSSIPEFKEEVLKLLGREIPGFKDAPASDIAFLASVHGTLVRYFRPGDKVGIAGLKDVRLIAETPNTSYEWTLSAMSVTALNIAALAKIGAIELTEERKSAILSDMERTVNEIQTSKRCRLEFAEAFRNSALKTFSQAPTVEMAKATPASALKM